MVRTWALREAYEFTPDTDFGETSETAWGQWYRLAPGTRLSGIAWYRGSTGTDAPLSLSLWDQISNVRIWHTDDVPDDGTVGWQEVDLTATPFDFFYVNPQVMISAYGGSGVHRTYGSQSSELKGEIPVNVALQAGYRSNSIGDQKPTAVHTGTIQGLDARFEVVPFVAPDVVSTNVEYELSRWLSEAGDHYDDSRLPFIAGQAAGANETVQDPTFGNAQIKADTAQLRTDWTTALASKLSTAADTVGSWLTTEANWYRQLVHDSAGTVASLVEKIGEITDLTVFEILAELIRWANGVNQPPQLADTTDWELVDETDFTNNLLWPVEADVYRVTLSSFDPAGTSEPVGTETRHAYLGKWCPFNVQFSSEWHYFNTTSADLWVGGRMPGLGLILYRPGAGHVQAWRRTEPT